MKKLSFSACIIALAAFLVACGDDEPSGPVPTVEFSKDRNFSEPGGTVTFTNNTTDGAEYFWEFGDGGISQDENPTHTYLETGDYTITLRARGSGGQEASMTSTIVVGSRFVTGVNFETIPFTDPDGMAWDDDDTGPDLALWIDITSNNIDPRIFSVITDLTPTQVPFARGLEVQDQFPFTDENWSFLLIENDEPFNEITFVDDQDALMLAAGINPLDFGLVDYQSGQGILTLITNDESAQIDILFQVRN